MKDDAAWQYGTDRYRTLTSARGGSEHFTPEVNEDRAHAEARYYLCSVARRRPGGSWERLGTYTLGEGYLPAT